MKKTIAALAALALLTSCAKPGQNSYGYQDVGKATSVEFGTVLASRPVAISGKNNGIGATAGIAGGALAGAQIGSGDGSIAGLLVGALVAGLAGHAIEQAMVDGNGIEYTVTLETGKTVTVAQNLVPEEAPVNVGDRVMVQVSGDYMRVLPAAHLPEEIEKPKGVKVRGAK